jgi:hypothetical protein
MGKWRYSSTIFNLGTKWRWVFSFAHLLLYALGKSPLYALDKRLDGSQRRAECYGEKKHWLSLPGIES